MVLWYEVFTAYYVHHQYYVNMLANATHWKLIIRSFLTALLPVWYILFSKKIKLSHTTWLLALWLLIFGYIHTWIKWWSVWWTVWAWWRLMLLINTLVLLAVAFYFVVWLLAVWTFLMQRILKITDTASKHMFLSFWLGLAWLMIIVQFLLYTWLFYSGIVWVLFLWLGCMIFLQKSPLTSYKNIIVEWCEQFSWKSIQKRWYIIFGVLLLILSIMYLYYGFQLAFIPYSTARDANHAYMYYPKIRADNNGIFRQNGPWGTPHLWYSYIAFWFSLIKPLGQWWISSATFAVIMNFLSAIFVVVFGLWLLKETTTFLGLQSTSTKPWNDIPQQTLFYTWRFLLLSWLTSWMGAFLVIVDNKTDLWVMLLTVLWLLAWFIAINYVQSQKVEKITKTLNKKNYTLYGPCMIFLWNCRISKTNIISGCGIVFYSSLMITVWLSVGYRMSIFCYLIACKT